MQVKFYSYCYEILNFSDINECEDSVIAINCVQHCINTFGGYECACYDGYEAINDTRQCIGKLINQCSHIHLCMSNLNYFADINECEEYNDCHQMCTNTNGSYYCSCNIGFALTADNRTCTGWFTRILDTNKPKSLTVSSQKVCYSSLHA